MREPSKFLTQEGLIGRAFMLHPFKLSSPDAAKAFWQVRWPGSSSDAYDYAHLLGCTGVHLAHVSIDMQQACLYNYWLVW